VLFSKSTISENATDCNPVTIATQSLISRIVHLAENESHIFDEEI
jgi:hypothetical protein